MRLGSFSLFSFVVVVVGVVVVVVVVGGIGIDIDIAGFGSGTDTGTDTGTGQGLWYRFRVSIVHVCSGLGPGHWNDSVLVYWQSSRGGERISKAERSYDTRLDRHQSTSIISCKIHKNASPPGPDCWLLRADTQPVSKESVHSSRLLFLSRHSFCSWRVAGLHWLAGFLRSV